MIAATFLGIFFVPSSSSDHRAPPPEKRSTRKSASNRQESQEETGVRMFLSFIFIVFSRVARSSRLQRPAAVARERARSGRAHVRSRKSGRTLRCDPTSVKSPARSCIYEGWSVLNRSGPNCWARRGCMPMACSRTRCDTAAAADELAARNVTIETGCRCASAPSTAAATPPTRAARCTRTPLLRERESGRSKSRQRARTSATASAIDNSAKGNRVPARPLATRG